MMNRSNMNTPPAELRIQDRQKSAIATSSPFIPNAFADLRRSISRDTVMSKKKVNFLRADDLNRSTSQNINLNPKEYMTTFGD